MSQGGAAASRVLHGLLPVHGREPHEAGRVATPLELLYDLTYVVALGIAAARFAEAIEFSHVGVGLLGFALAIFAILISWISFTWFASAFDTDDWLHRLLTMVQMAGVVVFAIGIGEMFTSLEEGDHLDIRAMVAGYVVMRVGLVGQWLRVAGASRQWRPVALRQAGSILLVQVGWIALAWAEPSILWGFVVVLALGLVEFAIPVVSQGGADGTPWHRHHIAERYGAFAIIALGEGVVGTVAASTAAADHGWDRDTVLILAIGIGLTFGLWWSYFLVPFGDLLAKRPGRGYVFGYGHVGVFAGIAGTGAGVHIAGSYLHHEGTVGPVGVVLSVAVPVGLFLVCLDGVVTAIMGAIAPTHLWLLVGTVALLVAGVLLAVAGVGVTVALLPVLLASFVPVIGHEMLGHRALQERIDRLA